MANQFFIIFLLTVAVARLFLFFKPTPAPTIKGFRIHHWMYGVIGVILGIVFHSVIMYAIGLGLFVDELTYILIRGKNHNDNYSKISLIGTLLFIVLVFFLRFHLVTIF